MRGVQHLPKLSLELVVPDLSPWRTWLEKLGQRDHDRNSTPYSRGFVETHHSSMKHCTSSSSPFKASHRCHNPVPRRAASARPVCVAAESLWCGRWMIARAGFVLRRMRHWRPVLLSGSDQPTISHRATIPALCSPELPLPLRAAMDQVLNYSVSSFTSPFG
jgi:hypothetical protein